MYINVYMYKQKIETPYGIMSPLDVNQGCVLQFVGLLWHCRTLLSTWLASTPFRFTVNKSILHIQKIKSKCVGTFIRVYLFIRYRYNSVEDRVSEPSIIDDKSLVCIELKMLTSYLLIFSFKINH